MKKAVLFLTLALAGAMTNRGYAQPQPLGNNGTAMVHVLSRVPDAFSAFSSKVSQVEFVSVDVTDAQHTLYKIYGTKVNADGSYGGYAHLIITETKGADGRFTFTTTQEEGR